jgi:hypothetical protein
MTGDVARVTLADPLSMRAIQLLAVARSWRCSNSPTWIPRQQSAARMTAAYISFSSGRSPNAWGVTLVRRRSSTSSAGAIDPVGCREAMTLKGE